VGIATSEYRSPRWIFVFDVARHLEAHRVEAHRAHQHSVRLNPANIERTFWSPKWSRTRDHRMELNGTRRHAWPQFQIQINTWTDRPSPINAGTRRNSLVSKTANGTGINPAVRLKGHSARLPSGLLISPPSRQGFRPSPAAISSSLLLIPGLRGRGSRGAEPSTFCAPFAWLERNTTARIIVSGVPPNVPSNPLRER
jgi:hypothetical protein